MTLELLMLTGPVLTLLLTAQQWESPGYFKSFFTWWRESQHSMFPCDHLKKGGVDMANFLPVASSSPGAWRKLWKAEAGMAAVLRGRASAFLSVCKPTALLIRWVSVIPWHLLHKYSVVVNYKKKWSCWLGGGCRDITKPVLFPMKAVKRSKCLSLAECMKKAKRFSELFKVGSIFHKMFNLTVT